MNPDLLPACWRYALSDHLASPGFAALRGFVASERQQHDVYPAEDHVFRAFTLTPLAAVRVVILGQDPYHGPGQAHGLSFSVPEGVRIPPSLRNLFKELQSDVGTPPVTHGCLEAWARQGVLLLNTVLTVRSGQAHSHRRQGWEAFTESVLRAVGQTAGRVFVLWGRPAQKSEEHIADPAAHLILRAAHPSPLSARRGFFGSRPFSQINRYLQARGDEPIDWRLPDDGNPTHQTQTPTGR